VGNDGFSTEEANKRNKERKIGVMDLNRSEHYKCIKIIFFKNLSLISIHHNNLKIKIFIKKIKI
jgi:hypothetical protein